MTTLSQTIRDLIDAFQIYGDGRLYEEDGYLHLVRANRDHERHQSILELPGAPGPDDEPMEFPVEPEHVHFPVYFGPNPPRFSDVALVDPEERDGGLERQWDLYVRGMHVGFAVETVARADGLPISAASTKWVATYSDPHRPFVEALPVVMAPSAERLLAEVAEQWCLI